VGRARKLCSFLNGVVMFMVAIAGCHTTGQSDPQDTVQSAMVSGSSGPPLSTDFAGIASFSIAPTLPADQRPLPINLAAALRLADVRAIDVAAAAARIEVSAAVLEQAHVLWLPTVTFGADWFRHDGIVQDLTSGQVLDDSHQGLVLGAGPTVNLDIGQAIFAPLVARQQLAARKADHQTASNDTLVAVTDAYFNVQEARGDLAGAVEAIRKSEELLDRTRKLAPEIVPELEVFRAETELAHLRDLELLYREKWKVASAELLRVVRLDPSAHVEPVEPPRLRIELIDLNKPVDELIPIGLTYRPELAAQQAQVQATLALLKQEKLRPLIPSLLIRGFSTPVAGTLGGGYAFYGNNGSLTNSQFRSDVDVQLLWRLDNLGFGNLAQVHQRQAENQQAVIELFRIQDRVAAEVARAQAQAQLAARRVEVSEKGLRSATLSVEKNLLALKKTKGVGDQEVTLVRPQEVVAAIQALSQAYSDFYGAIADANRAQFRLYRALGQPAQYVVDDQPCGNEAHISMGKLGPPQ
jgi:outer membrane protein TolC